MTPLDLAQTLIDKVQFVTAVIAAALLCAPWLPCFASESGEPWRPKSSSSCVSRLLVFPFAAIYVLFNLFVFVVSWFPARMQSTMHTEARVVPPLVGPVIVITCFGAGAIYWLWDLHIAPMLGYRTEALQEAHNGLDVQMSFNVSNFFSSYLISAADSLT